MSRNRHLALLGATAFATSVACHFEPSAPELVYTLNEEAIEDNDALAASPEARARLAGALEFLVGTPQSPSYLALPEWIEDGFYPNFWGYDWAFPPDGDPRPEVLAGNRQAYASQIAAIEAGEFEAVGEPRYAPDLWQRWQDHLAAMPEEGPDAEFYEGSTWREEGLRLFTHYYPTFAASAELYREQCFHCHGASGGGDGSTARFLNPKPRDYRNGTFKFTALNNKARPRHEDLMHILREGIYTTAMPSFRRFTDAQLSGLADYVRLLSVRGETEIIMAADYDPDDGIHFGNLQENYELVVDRWRAAEEELIVYDGDVPELTAERAARGRDLYMRADAANCVKCHGLLGRGDGESVKNNPQDATDDWGDPILPRDLTDGVFRFGRRPIDLYRRIYAGINGTPMPAHYDMQIVDGDGETRSMDEDDIWDLVAYVRSLSVREHEPRTASAEPAGGRGEEAH